jgi:hypothetical protein
LSAISDTKEIEQWPDSANIAARQGMVIAVPALGKSMSMLVIQRTVFFADRQVMATAALAPRRSTSMGLEAESVSTVGQAVRDIVGPVQIRFTRNSLPDQTTNKGVYRKRRSKWCQKAFTDTLQEAAEGKKSDGLKGAPMTEIHQYITRWLHAQKDWLQQAAELLLAKQQLDDNDILALAENQRRHRVRLSPITGFSMDLWQPRYKPLKFA